MIEECIAFVVDSLFNMFEVQDAIWEAVGGVSAIMLGYFTFHSLLRFYVQRFGGAFMQAQSDAAYVDRGR